MGIGGLLKQVAPLFQEGHLRELQGQTVAIDGYVWLHKSSYACALELCLNIPTEQNVKYFLRRVRMFRHFGVRPLVVFDGAKLESKSGTDEKRRELRKKNFKEGKALWDKAQRLKKGPEKRRLVELAREKFQRASHVSKAMVAKVCKALRKEKVEIVVAPFEADAQLIFLYKIHICQAIVTEDSDLIVFALAQEVEGCRLIYKLEESGDCRFLDVTTPKLMFDKYKAQLKANASDEQMKFLLKLERFDSRMLIQSCILSGCDYTEKLPGIGLRTAQDLILQFKSVDADNRVDRILKFQRVSKRKDVPDGYIDSFKRAEAQFYFQTVYDPRSKQLTSLIKREANPKEESQHPNHSFDTYDFLGVFPRELHNGEVEARGSGRKCWTDLDLHGEDKENSTFIENANAQSNSKLVAKRSIQHYFKPAKRKPNALCVKRRRVSPKQDVAKGTLFQFFKPTYKVKK